MDKNNTRERLSYLFNEGDEKEGFQSSPEFRDHIINFLKTPLVTDKFLSDYQNIASGKYAKISLASILKVIIKENKSFIEDVNEIFINQVRINPEIVQNKNPNFPLMFSYIVCNPNKKQDSVARSFSSTIKRLCSDQTIDIKSYSIAEINDLLQENHLKLYGIYEYIEGMTLGQYITSLKFIQLSDLKKWEFVKSVLMQVFCSLDSLSQSGGYTHFDLHTKNIIIKQEKLDHTYKLTNQVEIDISDPHRCFIIDQGLSNAEYDGKIFIYENTFQPFIPAADIYRLLSLLYVSLYNFDKDSPNSYHVNKLKTILITIFGESEDDDSVIKYINKNPINDVILYMYYSKSDMVQSTIENLSYNDFILLLLEF